MFTSVGHDFSAGPVQSAGWLVLVPTDDTISPLLPAGAVDALLCQLFEEDVQLLCLSLREGKCVHTAAVAGEIGRLSSTDGHLRGWKRSKMTNQ